MNSNLLSMCTAVLAFAAVSCTPTEIKEADFDVVPRLQQIECPLTDAHFVLNTKTIIAAPADDADLTRSARFLADYIREFTGLKVKVVDSASAPEKNVIILGIGSASEPESYEIDIDENRIALNGADGDGVFYGVQTLRKSLPIAEDGKVCASFAAGHIADAPRFHYRAMHLDVARHMFPVEFIKKYIDVMALHNINTFHWHITDDQGWRIEIKSYPELQNVAAYRNGTLIGHLTNEPLEDQECDGIRYGGYYTQDEVREIVAYAADRHIDIMPEIDMPGHMLAALSAYPELGCTGGPYEASQYWGVFPDVLCAGNEKVYDFLFAMLDEIVTLFPYEYVHIGGDECPKVRWRDCPKCQAKIAELGIRATADKTAEDQLQSYLMGRVGEYLQKYGKKIMAWDEMLDGGGVANATIMSWQGEQGGIAASLLGHDVVMVPTSHFYFDFYQTDDTENEPLAIGSCLPVQTVYSYNPVPEALKDNPEALAHILGVQANLWTEYITTPDYAEYMALPRMDALSEVQWSTHEKNWSYFRHRLDKMRAIYDKLGYNYAKHVFE